MHPATAAHLAMLLFSFLVAGSFSLGSLAANEISPMALNAARFWIASFVIGAAVLATTGVSSTAAQAPWRYFVLAGFFTTYFVLMFEGLKTAPPLVRPPYLRLHHYCPQVLGGCFYGSV